MVVNCWLISIISIIIWPLYQIRNKEDLVEDERFS